MKSRWMLPFLLCSLLSAPFLAPLRAAETKEPVFKDSGNCLMWEASSDSCRFRLLGSLHMGKEEPLLFDSAIADAWASSKALAVEVDILNPELSGAMVKAIDGKVFLPGDEKLSSLLEKDKAEKLDLFLKKRLRSSLANVEKLRPWNLYVMLTMASCVKAGWKEDFGIDRHFLKAARRDNLRLVELETPEIQIGALAGAPDSEMAALLMELAADPDEAAKQVESLVRCWRTGDADALSFYLGEVERISPKFVESAFYARNRGMSEGIKALAKGSDDFIVVIGAMHLVGERSVVELLRKEGFKLVQVPRRGAPKSLSPSPQ